MQSFLAGSRRILNGYFKLLQFIVTGLLGLMIIPVSLQIFSRYPGVIPRYIWTEEAARLLPWTGFRVSKTPSTDPPPEHRNLRAPVPAAAEARKRIEAVLAALKAD